MLYMTYPCLILPSRYIIENMYPPNIEMNLPIVGQVSKMKWEPSKNWNQFLPKKHVKYHLQWYLSWYSIHKVSLVWEWTFETLPFYLNFKRRILQQGI